MAQLVNVDAVLRQLQQDVARLSDEMSKMNTWVMALEMELATAHHEIRRLMPQVGAEV